MFDLKRASFSNEARRCEDRLRTLIAEFEGSKSSFECLTEADRIMASIHPLESEAERVIDFKIDSEVN